MPLEIARAFSRGRQNIHVVYNNHGRRTVLSRPEEPNKVPRTLAGVFVGGEKEKRDVQSFMTASLIRIVRSGLGLLGDVKNV